MHLGAKQGLGIEKHFDNRRFSGGITGFLSESLQTVGNHITSYSFHPHRVQGALS